MRFDPRLRTRGGCGRGARGAWLRRPGGERDGKGKNEGGRGEGRGGKRKGKGRENMHRQPYPQNPRHKIQPAPQTLKDFHLHSPFTPFDY